MISANMIEKNQIDIKAIRKDFPVLQQTIGGKPLVYLDNAATTQKPESVINSISDYYKNFNSNVHRGVHNLSERATKAYEGARIKIQKHINAKSASEVIYTRGTTEAINLVARSFGANFKAKDEIVISMLEHHSNIVPWQMLAKEKDLVIKVIPVNALGELEIEKLPSLLTEKTKIVAVNYISNAIGTINPAKDIIKIAHARNIPVLLDGAQALPHLKIDVQDLDCDFLALSGHKAYGPTGIGILYGKEKLLESMPPFLGGGDMILKVSMDETVYNELPYKFEAGTPHIAGAIGFGEALDYINAIGLSNISKYENYLLTYATNAIKQIPNLRIIGEANIKAPVISFVMSDLHPHDIGSYLDSKGVAVRAGHHCTMPLMQFYKLNATSRASFAIYNTKEEIDIFIQALKDLRKFFKL